MDENDSIDQKFKTAFTGFEQEPPPEAWDRLHAVLHPPVPPKGLLARIAALLLAGDKPLSFYLAIAGISLGLFSGIYYFGFNGRYAIRGHAYVGELRLKGGVATLFESTDKTLPWDSLEYSRSDNIDEFGHFRFARLKPGRYLLHIAPADDRSGKNKYLPTWYKGLDKSDSARVLSIENRDLTIEIYLLRNQ
jgi:hypothetical protein